MEKTKHMDSFAMRAGGKNIALRAGLASPNQLRHGSAQASLALLIWLKRWIGKDELLNIFNRRFIVEDSLIACNDCLYRMWELIQPGK